MQPACQAGPARFRASNAAVQRRLSIATTAPSVNKCLTSNFVRRNQRAKQVRHDSGRPALPCSDNLAHDDPRKLSPDQPVKRLWRSQRFPQSGPPGLKDRQVGAPSSPAAKSKRLCRLAPKPQLYPGQPTQLLQIWVEAIDITKASEHLLLSLPAAAVTEATHHSQTRATPMTAQRCYTQIHA
jgi:hypothetical protein